MEKIINDDCSRRDFLKATARVAGGIAALTTYNPILAAGSGMLKSELALQLAGYDYDRLAALSNGKVKIEGCDIKFTNEKIGDMNTNMFSGPQNYDISEIGLHPFMLAFANDNFRDYTLLPIFPLRLFRHKSVFIRNDRGIKKPQDLRGRRIATPGYSSTSLTWIRGIFQDEYGLSPEDVEWVISVKDSSAGLSGGASGLENVFPKGLTVIKGSAGKDESDLLVSGEVDALFHAVEPRAYTERHPKVSRLFSDSRAVEQAYYAKTGIFPIMHAVAIRKTILKQNPWLVEAVFNAYSKAKELSYTKMSSKGWAWDSLPWYGQEFESTKALMGDNYYSYGMTKANRKTLETFFNYSYKQGLSSRELTVEELFVPESLELLET